MLLVSEIFNLVEKAKTEQDKIAAFNQHKNDAVLSILFLNFNPSLRFLLPEGEPPFKKDTDRPMGYNETNLMNEIKRFYIFTTPDINIHNIKREALFISMLEGLHWTEAEILCLAKDKNLTSKFPSLTEELVRKAYPFLLPPPDLTQIKEPLEKGKRTKKSLSSVKV